MRNALTESSGYLTKAIVSGAGGFLGKALVHRLSESGIQVFAVVREQAEHVDVWEDSMIIPICCDLSHIAELPERLHRRDIDVFYHFAWSGTAGPNRGNIELQLSNAKYSCDAVRAAKRLGCKRFIFAASIMEYECHQAMLMGKATGLGTVYSAGKLAADYMTCALADELGLSYSAVIISNVYGPGESSPRLIYTTIKKLLAGEAVPCTAGEQIYDFVYISDAASAFVQLCTVGHLGRRYYLGSLSPQPLKCFLLQMEDCISKGSICLGELPFTGVSLDYKQFEQILIWPLLDMQPMISFEDGIQKTADWIRRES